MRCRAVMTVPKPTWRARRHWQRNAPSDEIRGALQLVFRWHWTIGIRDLLSGSKFTFTRKRHNRPFVTPRKSSCCVHFLPLGLSLFQEGPAGLKGTSALFGENRPCSSRWEARTRSLMSTTLISRQKYAVPFRRESDQMCPIHGAVWAKNWPAVRRIVRIPCIFPF